MKYRFRLEERLAHAHPAAVTVVSLALATLLLAALTSHWGRGYTFITFYPAIMLSTMIGGWRHGLFAIAVSVLLSFGFFIDVPQASFNQIDALVLFASVNLLMIACVEKIIRARRKAETEAAAANAREEAMRWVLDAHSRNQQLDNALRDSQERMQEALRVSHSFTFEWDLPSDRMCRSASCEELLGFNNGNLAEGCGQHYYRRIHPEDLQRLQTLQRELHPGNDRYSAKYRFAGAGGDIKVLEESARGFFNAAGELSRLIGICTDVTAREKAEEERQKFVLLADSSQEFIGMCDLDFKPFYANAAGMNMVGLDNLEAACKVKVQDYFFPEDRPFINGEFFPRVMRDGSGEVEIRFRHFKTGEGIWMLHNVFAIRDARGAVVGWATVSRNIDARKRAEDALRQATERERFLADVIDNADIAFRAGTADGRLLMCNRAFTELTGYSREELLRQDFNVLTDLTPAEWRETDAMQQDLALRKRQPVRYEKEYLRKDGIRIPVELFIQPIFDNADTFLHYRAFITDISARKQTEAALQQAHDELETRVLERTVELRQTMEMVQTERQRFQDVLDQLPAYVVLLSPDYRIKFSNRYFRERFGEDHGRRCYEYLFDLAAPCAICETFKVLQDNAAHRWEWTGPDGRIYDIYDFPFNDVDGAPLIMEIGLDITERRAAETELERHRHRLTELVLERTTQLENANAQLHNEIIERKAAEKALREADRRKDEFLATLAHELRNPLAPIRNTLELLRRSAPIDPTLDKMHAMMTRQVAQLTRLVDDLLEISRITCGKIELLPTAVLLATVVHDAVDCVRPYIDACGHTLTVHLPETPVTLLVDAARLTQVLSNLLNNAAKFTPQNGSIEVFADTVTDSAGMPGLLLGVRDNGIGIPHEMQESIFDMFSQAANRGSGLGIGLTLVRQLVMLQGGTVTVRSDGPGRGSEFRVWLPQTCRAETPSEAIHETLATREAPPGRRLLVVDDNRDAADSLAALLEVLGWQVQRAYNGAEALQTMTVWRPQLVFLDIGMADMDGCEVARRIRAVPGNAAVTLVALTGWGQEEMREKTRSAGFNYHLVKPVDINLLEALLAKLECA